MFRSYRCPHRFATTRYANSTCADSARSSSLPGSGRTTGGSTLRSRTISDSRSASTVRARCCLACTSAASISCASAARPCCSGSAKMQHSLRARSPRITPDASLVAGDVGSGDPFEQRERRGDDRERREDPGDDEEVVLHARSLQCFVELRAQEQVRGKQPGCDGYNGGDQERSGGLERDDAPQDGESGSGQPQQAEGPFTLGQPAGDADRQAAAGDGQAGQDD